MLGGPHFHKAPVTHLSKILQDYPAFTNIGLVSITYIELCVHVVHFGVKRLAADVDSFYKLSALISN